MQLIQTYFFLIALIEESKDTLSCTVIKFTRFKNYQSDENTVPNLFFIYLPLSFLRMFTSI